MLYFGRHRLVLRRRDDQLDVRGPLEEEPGLDVLLPDEVGAEPVREAAGLAHVDRRALRVLPDVDAGAIGVRSAGEVGQCVQWNGPNLPNII
jgi:hypothetical protein